jgi:hypothetical protein
LLPNIIVCLSFSALPLTLDALRSVSPFDACWGSLKANRCYNSLLRPRLSQNKLNHPGRITDQAVRQFSELALAPFQDGSDVKIGGDLRQRLVVCQAPDSVI